MSGYRTWNDTQLIEAVKSSYSMSEVLRKLNLIQAGGNFYHIKKHILRLNLNTSHWLGQGWRLGRQLKHYEDYSRITNARRHIISNRGRKCNKCQLTEWQTKPIPLEIHHIDGDNTNNSEENIELLCPNCHALTDNWRGRGMFGRSFK